MTNNLTRYFSTLFIKELLAVSEKYLIQRKLWFHVKINPYCPHKQLCIKLSYFVSWSKFLTDYTDLGKLTFFHSVDESVDSEAWIRASTVTHGRMIGSSSFPCFMGKLNTKIVYKKRHMDWIWLCMYKT